MPRRNRREVYQPLDLSPTDLKQFRIRAPLDPFAPKPPRDRVDEMQVRVRREHEAAERQRTARINGGIDWTICIVPGCGNQLILWGVPEHHDPAMRDHSRALPICWDHMHVVRRQAERLRSNSLWTSSDARVEDYQREQHRRRHEAEKQAHMAVLDGHIYYVRLNGLVKVGWSRDVDERLRAYGPEVEVLCIYPASRDDETHLHRQLRPVLARGREWYQDGPVIADFVKAAQAVHGYPEFYDTWTKPKATVGGKRINRR